MSHTNGLGGRPYPHPCHYPRVPRSLRAALSWYSISVLLEIHAAAVIAVRDVSVCVQVLAPCAPGMQREDRFVSAVTDCCDLASPVAPL